MATNEAPFLKSLRVVQVPPVYPPQAAENNLEGWCIVEFDVSKIGRTENQRIFECEPEGIFEEASINAVKQFLYMPPIRNWEPVSERGVKNKISFKH